MSQKKKQYSRPTVKKAPESAPVKPQEQSPSPSKPLSFSDFKVQAAIIGLIAFVLYFNTFFNEYAHDDGIVIVKNEYVQEGIAGLPKIFTTDAYDSYYRQLNTINQLSGGRYRPLSIATFAIEQQFFGATPVDQADSFVRRSLAYGVSGPKEKSLMQAMHARHVVNVLFYIVSVIVLLYFLRNVVFKEEPLIAFLATLIFAIHPIHTEVVANVKSRDEIMSLLFMCLTLIFAYKYENQIPNSNARSSTPLLPWRRDRDEAFQSPKKKIKWLLLGMLCYFLTFLSKEYAISLIFLLPLMLYLFRNYSIPKSMVAFLPYLLVIVAYFAIRVYIAIQMAEQNTGESVKSLEDLASLFTKTGNSDKEVLNNPYCFATPIQKLATEIATSLNYLKLLIFPHPLSADYSYNSIPYKNFASPLVWLSILVHGALIGFMIVLFRMRHVLCFAIAFYFLHLLLINNTVFNIGATMGERLIYHSSVGFAMAAAWFIYRVYQRIKPANVARASLIAFMSVIVILCGIQTIARNANWKNDSTLFLHDVNVVPNSVLANANDAASYISLSEHQKNEQQKRMYLRMAIDHLNKAITMHDLFVAGYLNRGLAYYKLGMLDSSLADINMVRKLYPTYPTLKAMYALLTDHYVKSGWSDYGKRGDYAGAIAEFKRGLAIDSTNADLWYNIGGAAYSNKQYNEAIYAFKRTLQLNPNFKDARQGLQAAMDMVKSEPPANK